MRDRDGFLSGDSSVPPPAAVHAVTIDASVHGFYSERKSLIVQYEIRTLKSTQLAVPYLIEDRQPTDSRSGLYGSERKKPTELLCYISER